MQARVSAIGIRLVPRYQRELPDTDETKINFRFQVVGHEKWHDAVAWPNGIILVPYDVVERLQNDSQLAAVLADNIACALEKQGPHAIPAARKMSAFAVAGAIGSAFVPGLVLAMGPANEVALVAADVMIRHAREQSGRVSLGLLRDAGYDVTQAPLAWWLLAPGKAKKLEEIAMPERATYLYKVLGETWHGN
jgi:predicted Zn-dependent protease